MTRGWKIGLSVLAGLFFLLILVGGGCLYALSRYGKEIGEQAKQSQTDGENFGRSTNEAGCLKEALERKKKNSSITNIVSINVFLGTCLKEAEPSPGFCEDVPPRGEKEQIKAWTARKCAETGQADITCQAMFQVVLAHCQGSDIPSTDKPKTN